MYYEFKMVDPALRKVHTETNQGEIFKVFEEENIFLFFSILTYLRNAQFYQFSQSI